MAQVDAPALLKSAKPALVVITTLDKKGNLLRTGAGFFINSKGEIITNLHVMEKAVSATVRCMDGKTYDVLGVIREDEDWNLAKLMIDLRDKEIFPFLELATKLPQEGDRAFVIENLTDSEQRVFDGLVSSVRTVPDLGPIIQISIPMPETLSGSPVLDGAGKVLGVAVVLTKEGKSVSLAIPSQKVAELESGDSFSLYPVYATPEKLYQAALNRIKSMDYVRALFLAEELAGSGIRLFGNPETTDDLQKVKRAVDLCNKIIQSKPDLADAHYSLATLLARLGDTKGAIEACKKAIKLNPDDPIYYSELGDLYLELKEYQKAIEAIKISIKLEPGPFHYVHLGKAYLAGGQPREALRAFFTAVKTVPTSEMEPHTPLAPYPPYLSIDSAYSIHSEYQKDAVVVFQKAVNTLKADPKTPPGYLAQAYFHLGESHERLGYHDKAIEALNQALKIEPQNPSRYVRLGKAYLAGNQPEDALQAFLAAVKMGPTSELTSLYCSIGLAYSVHSGHQKDAVKFFQEAVNMLKTDPKTPPSYLAEAYFYLGESHERLGQHDKAIEALKEAVKIKPGDESYVHKIADVYIQWGHSYSKLGKYVEAINTYKKARELDPENTAALFPLGLLYVGLGQYTEAVAALTQQR